MIERFGSYPWPELLFFFPGKTLYSVHLSTLVYKFNPGRSRNTPSRFVPHGNRDKLRTDGLLGSNADSVFYHFKGEVSRKFAII